MGQHWGQGQQSLRVSGSISSTAGLGQREGGEAGETGKEQALAWPEGFIAQPGSGARPKAQSWAQHTGLSKTHGFIFTVRSAGW